MIINHEHSYLGKYASAESREKYARLIAEVASFGSQSIAPPRFAAQASPASINELILAFWRFAKSHYVKDGSPTRALEGAREALRPLRQLYGSTPASEFGPKKLKALRHSMIESGLSRGVVNHRVGRIKRMFKWAVAEKLVPPSVYHGLQAVTGLQFGRTQARETEPVRPVADLYVAAVLPFVSPQVAGMIKLQRLTGMRPGELVIMRPCDIDMTNDVWIYEPFDHKNRWRGHRKQVPLGPEAQAILKDFLDRDPQAFLFSPQESERWRRENRPPYHGRQRKTPVYPSELRRRQKLKEPRRRRKPKRPKRERYDTNSYRRAITEPGWMVRILTKNAAVVEEFDLIKRHRDRVLVGISLTATSDKDDVIAVVEPNASSIRDRMAALKKAHKMGLRTYGMLCPLLPGIADNAEQIEELVDFVVRCGAEEIFCEAVNARGSGLRITEEGLRAAGYASEAAAVNSVRRTKNWSGYAAPLQMLPDPFQQADRDDHPARLVHEEVPRDRSLHDLRAIGPQFGRHGQVFDDRPDLVDNPGRQPSRPQIHLDDDVGRCGPWRVLLFVHFPCSLCGQGRVPRRFRARKPLLVALFGGFCRQYTVQRLDLP